MDRNGRLELRDMNLQIPPGDPSEWQGIGVSSFLTDVAIRKIPIVDVCPYPTVFKMLSMPDIQNGS